MKKRNMEMVKWAAVLVVCLSIIYLTGCGKQSGIVDPANSTSQALLTKAVNDPAVASFEPNYNEEDISGFVLGKTTTAIYTVKVWQKMTRIDRSFDVKYSGDTAYGKVTSNFDGILYLAGSFNKPVNGTAVKIDTVISKKFSTVVTHNVIMVRKVEKDDDKDADKDGDTLHWRVVAVSLPVGGTLTSSIQIQKMTVFLANGDTLSITSPNDYYLYRESMGHKRMLPGFMKNGAITIRVELTSADADTDYITATHGAVYDKFFKGQFRIKTKFNLVSATPLQGGKYYKVYEVSLKKLTYMGFFHAVINAIPRGVVNDDKAPVEVDTWGLPYNVKM